MPLYAYAARALSGRLVEGQMEAPDAGSVAMRLEADQIIAVRIELQRRQSRAWAALRYHWHDQPPRLGDLLLFTRQLVSITRSGLPLLRGMRGLAASTTQPVLKRTLASVAQGLESGRSLAEAMALHPAIFPPVYLSMVKVGEQTGTLDTLLARLAEHLEAEQDLRDRVAGALRYPTIVLCAIAGAIAVLTTFVIPKFAPMFSALQGGLPWPTRALLGLSALVSNHWLAIVVGVAAVTFAVRWYVRQPKGRLLWHTRQLRLPIFGQLIMDAALARLLSTLSLTLAAGVPMLEALQLVAHITDNDYLARRVHSMRTGVESGESLSRVANRSELLPPLVLQMVEVGEETGELPRLLEEVAAHYRRDVDYRLKHLTTLLEPALLVVVGVLVALLALGLFLPLWDMLGQQAAR